MTESEIIKIGVSIIQVILFIYMNHRLLRYGKDMDRMSASIRHLFESLEEDEPDDDDKNEWRGEGV